MRIPNSSALFLFPSLILLLTSCVYQQIEPIRPPGPGTESQDLEARFSETPPTTFSHPYWFSADYKSVSSENIVTGQINPEDGILNVSGTFNGTTQFNKGNDPELTLKAAYDNENIYILASWKDETVNSSQRSWLFDGPSDIRKGDDPAGWTSQRSDDKIEFIFEMTPSSFDVWQWSLALSEPLGFAIDMIDNGSPVVDDGDLLFKQNIAGSDFRSGPKYEWDGTSQELTRELSGFTILDPSFYLMNKVETSGDVALGESVYQNSCALCHGVDGDGEGFEWATGRRMNIPGEFTGITFSGLEAMVDTPEHSGQTYWQGLNNSQKVNLHTRLKAYSGYPGYYLEDPTMANSDVKSRSNVALGRITGENENGYQVLLVRKLNTGHPDDIVFDPSVENYSLKVHLYDNDEINRIGSGDFINLILK